MQKISMLLFLALILLNCSPEEEFNDVDLTVRSTIQTSKEKNEANRIRVKNIEALRKLPFSNLKNRKEVTVLGYYEPNDGGGGIFKWDPISEEEDNGGTIISLQGNEIGRWKREYNDTINVKWFGAKEDPNFDNSVIFQTIINLQDENLRIIEIHGRYKINSTIYLNFIDGLLIQGKDESEIYTNEVIKLISARRMGFVRDLTVRNLKFSNYSQSSLYSFDLFYFEEVCLKNIVFQFCQFSSPQINSNAIKFINQNNCLTENISFLNCQFSEIGRMGIEIQNHNYLDNQIRYKNIKVIESSFTNVGNLSFGMGISLSGYGEGFIAEKNTFKGYPYSGIEIVGCSNNLIIGNNFAGGKGAGIRMSGEIKMFNTNIYNNYNSSIDGGNFFFYNVQNVEFRENYFNSEGYFMFRDAQKVNFNGGKLESKGNYSVYVENSNNIKFSDASLDNSLSLRNFSVIRTYGECSNVEVHSSELKKGIGGVFFDGINGADYPLLYDVKQY